VWLNFLRLATRATQSFAMLWAQSLFFLGVLAALHGKAEEQCDASTGCAAKASTFEPEDVQVGQYYWSNKNGNRMGTSASPHTVMIDFNNTPPTWKWDNEGDELGRATPLLDDKKNIYLTTGNGYARKFSPDGKLLWQFRVEQWEGKTPGVGNLHRGSLFFYSVQGWVFSLDMETGKLNWKKQVQASSCHDSGTTFAYNGTVVFPTHSVSRLPKEWEFSADRLVALDAATGDKLWHFDVDSPYWNFHGSTSGDGNLLSATYNGRVYSIRLSDGGLNWKSGYDDPRFWSTGGGTLGPNGIFYAESNHWLMPGGPGIVAAYRATDGKQLWVRAFGGLLGAQVPAVGRLGPGKPLSVVAGMGRNTEMPYTGDGSKYPVWMQNIYLWLRQQWWYWAIVGPVENPNRIVAMDAETGNIQWQFDEEVWRFPACAGDEAKMPERQLRRWKDMMRTEHQCGPDNWGVPTISADGTVYATSGHTGHLFAIKDKDNNGAIDSTEYTMFETKNGFLNGPSIAPGILATIPCWGPMYVWRT